MDNKVHHHLVIEEHDGSWNIVSELLLNSLNFSIPGISVAADDRLHNEAVEALILTGSSWVLRGAHVLVVTLEMLVQEVRVHELGVSPSTSHLVYCLPLVEELVTTDGVQTAEVAPLEAEEEVLAVSFGLQFEPVTVDVNMVTHDDESPDPGQRFKNIESIEWDPESLVVEKCSLTFLSEVLIIILCNEVDDWASQVHQPYWQK
jgi:hypothetical protein